MSFDVLSDLNWLAVIVAAIGYWALGALWYSPVGFGKAWARSIGWETNEQFRPSPAVYVLPLIAYFVAAIALGMLAQATASDTFGEGLVLGLVVGVGVAAAILFVTATFDPKSPRPWTWFGITGAYHVLGLVIAGVIVSVWT
jgi:hypothetical protein